ncbi:hypothetical protein IMG5_160340 [Ichthyophthirius multifiliis]|uniref:Uncharacterized protein n=1 Tax=Ichthyophthirius multifiliis TaxID=5932 RepID=G0QZX3_ICHMU|nr:hypothetical protein IMG5_160340 [Ichthyophthirius multifiliis]EGR29235.1 hypothetical protein IMG5_160340 [Ichthyophthirius multifiliis]|eukprot:XP_004030471.1 hypothetical protein IMG5_160340 [Ichthyophthirius multifiliis]
MLYISIIQQFFHYKNDLFFLIFFLFFRTLFNFPNNHQKFSPTNFFLKSFNKKQKDFPFFKNSIHFFTPLNQIKKLPHKIHLKFPHFIFKKLPRQNSSNKVHFQQTLHFQNQKTHFFLNKNQAKPHIIPIKRHQVFSIFLIFNKTLTQYYKQSTEFQQKIQPKLPQTPNQLPTYIKSSIFQSNNQNLFMNLQIIISSLPIIYHPIPHKRSFPQKTTQTHQKVQSIIQQNTKVIKAYFSLPSQKYSRKNLQQGLSFKHAPDFSTKALKRKKYHQFIEYYIYFPKSTLNFLFRYFCSFRQQILYHFIY